MLRQVLAAEPANANALNYLGYMLAVRGEQLDEAITLVRRALDAEPDNGAYLDSLGWAHFRRGDLDEAEKYLSPPPRSCRRTRRSRIISAISHARKGRLPEAIAAWTRALKGDGQDVEKAAIEKKISNAKGKMQNANEVQNDGPMKAWLRFLHFEFAFCITARTPRRVPLPTDSGRRPSRLRIRSQASLIACRGVDPQALLSLRGRVVRSGSAGALRRLRAAGLDASRGLAPLGQPVFILAAQGGTGVLLLPRESRVLRGQPRGSHSRGAHRRQPRAGRSAGDPVTGCVVPDPKPTGGRMHANGWASIDLQGGARCICANVAVGVSRRATRRLATRRTPPAVALSGIGASRRGVAERFRWT